MSINTLVEVKANSTGYGLLIERDNFMVGHADTINQIREDIENKDKFVIPDKFVVSAVFQKYGIKNANGRIYPKEVLVREVDKYIRERVNTRRAIGALDHPDSANLSGHDVAHIITNLEWVNSTLIGEMELHLSPGFRRYGTISTSGDKVANMLIDNYMIGVSSRGLGSVQQSNGALLVGNDFELVCWDVVVDPSTNGSFIGMNRQALSQFMESKKNGTALTQLNENCQKILEILS